MSDLEGTASAGRDLGLGAAAVGVWERRPPEDSLVVSCGIVTSIAAAIRLYLYAVGRSYFRFVGSSRLRCREQTTARQ